jgi:hypothetical protein
MKLIAEERKAVEEIIEILGKLWPDLRVEETGVHNSDDNSRIIVSVLRESIPINIYYTLLGQRYYVELKSRYNIGVTREQATEAGMVFRGSTCFNAVKAWIDYNFHALEVENQKFIDLNTNLYLK